VTGNATRNRQAGPFGGDNRGYWEPSFSVLEISPDISLREKVSRRRPSGQTKLFIGAVADLGDEASESKLTGVREHVLAIDLESFR
jgi:hypothetical protein